MYTCIHSLRAPLRLRQKEKKTTIIVIFYAHTCYRSPCMYIYLIKYDHICYRRIKYHFIRIMIVALYLGMFWAQCKQSSLSMNMNTYGVHGFSL